MVISGDVSENPGPTLEKPKCQQCFRTIARNHRIITCSLCDSTYHIKCGGVTPEQHKTKPTSDQTWNCLRCAQLTATFSDDALTELPFSHTTDESLSSLFGGNHQDSIGDLTAELATNADDLYNMTNELNAAPEDIRVGHLNICNLRNKTDELIAEIKDISSPLTIISGISYYTPEQNNIKRIQYAGDNGSICKEECFVP